LLEGVPALEQFTFVKRGYDPEEVDRYISTLEQVIKSYKEKDNAIKNAIISAQVAADNMIKNAKAQANEYKSQIAKELDKVGVEVERQRMQVQAFQDVYEGLIRKYLTEIDKQEISEIYARLEDVERLIERLKEADIMPAPTPEGMPASNTGYGPPPPREAPPPGFPPLPPAPISNPGLIN